jgi:uncharacterized membrane-anchored protein YhcB (DUF1043 family)
LAVKSKADMDTSLVIRKQIGDQKDKIKRNFASTKAVVDKIMAAMEKDIEKHFSEESSHFSEKVRFS